MPFDFMKKCPKTCSYSEFTKDDLKEGMIVETGDGKRYLIIHGRAIGEHDYFEFRVLRYDLSHEKAELTINKVFKVNEPFGCFSSMLRLTHELLWERPKKPTIKELNADEAAQLLKDKFPEYNGVKITL